MHRILAIGTISCLVFLRLIVVKDEGRTVYVIIVGYKRSFIDLLVYHYHLNSVCAIALQIYIHELGR